MSRTIRCVACAKRIRDTHPHVGVTALDKGQEFHYPARSACQERCADETARRLEAGSVYVISHYHGAVCPDKAPGFGCSGGCFDAMPGNAVAN